MLVDLSLTNFALATQLDLEFGPGLNVLTGETGAGKSIIIGAVMALIGGRISSSQVRQGAKRAILSASFDISSDSPAAAYLREMDLWDEGEELIVGREINVTGRNRSRINGRLTNVSHLAGLGTHLVDIHGQHDHQSLMRSAGHVDLLDAMGDETLARLRKNVEQLFDQRSALLARIEQIRQNEKDRERQEDILKYQIEEIEAAGLEPGEEEKLEQEWTRLSHAERLSSGVRDAYTVLYEGTGRGQGATELVGEALQTLEALQAYDAEISRFVETMRDALTALEEAAWDLRRYGDELAADPGRLEQLDERRQTIMRLKRKYGESIHDILSFLDACRAELDALTSAGETLDRLEQEEALVAEQLARAASQLSAARKQLARHIDGRITAHLEQLSMPAAQFVTHFSSLDDTGDETQSPGERRIGRRGQDKIEFLFSANAGEKVKPLAAIASGGEMSRVMLAIKAAMAEADPVPTLIFDEIDAGLGGHTAERVADTLAQLAQTHQVLVVTHLAQIAARAHRHMLVEKTDEGDRTTIRVKPLEGDERIREIARMLDGLTTPTSLQHARALLDRFHPSTKDNPA